jgi:biopolymer transport protein ExbD
MVRCGMSHEQGLSMRVSAMMILTVHIALLALLTFGAFLPAKAAATENTSETASHFSQPSVVFVDLPVAYADGSNPDNCPLSIPPAFDEPAEEPTDNYKIHKIGVDEDGNTLFNGMKIAAEDFDKAVKTYLVADGLTQLQIQPYAQAQAGPVLKMLGALMDTGFPCHGFVGNWNYAQIFKAKAASAGPWPQTKPDFLHLLDQAPKIDPVAIHITSTDVVGREPSDPQYAGAALDGRCRAYFGNKPVSNKELVSSVTATMRSAYDRAMTVQRKKNETVESEMLPDGLILTTPTTPWRCVGGIVYNLQLSGFIRVGFGLIPDS